MQWEQTFVKGIVSEISIKDRIQSQKVDKQSKKSLINHVSITSSQKRVIRKGWFVAYQDFNKDSARIWGSKWNLLHVVLSAHAHYIQE